MSARIIFLNLCLARDFFGVTYPEGVRPIETMEKLAAFLENVGTVNPAAPVSYTHLDVYKRQF